MAIKLASSFKTVTAPSSGFDLKFTEGTVYDLDRLFTSKKRDSDEESLYIEVKKDTDISKKVFDRIKSDLRVTLNDKLSSDTTKAGINEIIKKVVKNDNVYTKNIPVAVQNQLNTEITKYLTDLTGLYGINYSIVINETGYNITYKFETDDRLKELFTNYYNTYKAVYSSELSVGSGQLGILDRKQRENISLNDCKKYLFCTCFDKPDNSNKKPLLTGYRPVVIWEDATEDTSTESENTTLYSNISEMMEIIHRLQDNMTNMENRLTDKINVDEQNMLITDKNRIPTVGAVYDYAQFNHGSYVRVQNGVGYTSGMSFQLSDDPEMAGYYQVELDNRFSISKETGDDYSINA